MKAPWSSWKKCCSRTSNEGGGCDKIIPVKQTLSALLIGMLWLACWVQADQAAEPGATVPLQEGVLLRFDHLDWDFAHNHLVASGNVQVEYGLLVFSCSKVEITGSDLLSGKRLGQPKEAKPGEGKAKRTSRRPHLASGEPRPTLYVRGNQLKITATEATIDHVRISTCPPGKADYSLSAAQLTLDPKGVVTLKHLALYLYGTKILTYPAYHIRLGPRTGKGLSLPVLGYSNDEGLFLYYDKHFPITGDLTFDFEPRYSLEEQTSGTLGLTLGQGKAQGHLAVESDNYTWDRSGKTIFLSAHPLSEVDYTTTVTGLPLQIKANYAHFEEKLSGQAGRTHRERAALQVKLTPGAKSLSDTWDYRWNVLWSRAEYSGEAHFETVQTGLRLYYQVNSTDVATIGYWRRWHWGETPFEFDDVDVDHELELGYNLGVRGHWGGGVKWTYDLAHGDSFDTVFETTYRQRCLEYSLSYSTNHKSFSFSLGLPGF